MPVNTARILSTLLLALWASNLGSPLAACSVPTPPDPGTMTSNSDLIVLGIVLEYAIGPADGTEPMGTHKGPSTTVRFRIQQTLKGTTQQTLELVGSLQPEDDFNDHTPPYQFVRPGGRDGSCWAYEYKQGASYLLFLKQTDGGYRVNWYPLGPVNEQVTGADDPWVWWVKGYLAGKEIPENQEAVPPS